LTSLLEDVKKCSLYAFQVYTLLDRYPRTHPLYAIRTCTRMHN
jgi:hypothetical protein